MREQVFSDHDQVAARDRAQLVLFAHRTGLAP
jgi:hypothetical protein